jgi:DNA processing protein
VSREADYIRLAAAQGVGPVMFFALISKFQGDAGEALAFLAKEGKKKIPSAAYAESQLKKAEEVGAQLILSGSDDYPPMLSQALDRPPFLWLIGDRSVLQTRMIGIVGSRHASLNSRNFATQLARHIAREGFTIASGMAIGIDTAAHNGALEADNGKTIAVLAGGADVLYPPSNHALYERLKAGKGCAVISDMPLGTAPASGLFPKRNRIVAGMSEAVIIAEASLKSGSLITARLALEYDREVFAVPNFPLDPRAHGCNDLIKKGHAALCDRADDVIEALGKNPKIPPKNDVFHLEESVHAAGPTPASDEVKNILLENLSSEPVGINVILRALSEIPHAAMFSAIISLERSGQIKEVDGGLIRVM